MAKFESIAIDQTNQHDLLIEVMFKDSLTPANITGVLQLVNDTVMGYEANNLDFELVGISSLQIDTQTLSLSLRFDVTDDEHIRNQKANFVMYLFAKIDKQYPLSDTPFPDTFRDFLNLRAYYGLE